MLKTPIVILNVKCYEEATGKNLDGIVEAMNTASEKYGVSAAIAVQPTDIYRVSIASKIPVLAQHVDPIKYGSHTGYILPEAVKFAGAKGTLMNHAEHRLRIWEIDELVKKTKELELSQVV